MRILRSKVAGHFNLKNSEWFTVDSALTTISGGEGSGKTILLKALRSINPVVCCNVKAPFAEYPRFIKRGGLRRKVMPAKKTAVIAVYLCSESLRHQLVEIDPVFYETDRIEVGRRLDNSRWITFVEIAGSSRWSELVGDFRQLKGSVQPYLTEKIDDDLARCEELAPETRVKGELAEFLNDLITALELEIDPSLQETLERFRFKVNREARFRVARRVVENNLPDMLYLGADYLLHDDIDTENIVGHAHAAEDDGRHCLDIFLLSLLGIGPIHDIDSHRLQPAPDVVSRLSALIADGVEKYRPGKSFDCEVNYNRGRVEMLCALDGTNFIPPSALPVLIRWLIGGIVCRQYYLEVAHKKAVWLLDDPFVDMPESDRRIFYQFLSDMKNFFQIIFAGRETGFRQEQGKSYELQQESEEAGYKIV